MTMTATSLLFLLSGLLAGGMLTYLLLKSQKQKARKTLLHDYESLKNQLRDTQTSLTIAENNAANLKETLETLRDDYKEILSENSTLKQSITQKETELKNLQRHSEEQKEEVSQLRKQFLMEFENVASKLLKSNSREFAEANQKRLDEILTPFKERIEKFEKTVQDNHVANVKEQSTLRSELKNLHTLNQQMTEEARNLTRALKGDSKKQGAWGEILLEKVLERSGLRKGYEYEREVAVKEENHRSLRPDAVVYLPEKKHIIIDAKVSLNAYQKSVEAEDEEERRQHLKAHLLSVKAHIKSLSEKSYHLSEEFDTPEFTLMFMPLEPAFSAMLEYDNEVFNEAWDRKIIIVSPTTLLATLRTVASLWKHERQTENAINIAREGGRLYDRIALFMQEFEKMEKPLDQAKASYLYLRDKLTTSRQSISGTAQRLKELGVKTSKNIPGRLSGNTTEEESP